MRDVHPRVSVPFIAYMKPALGAEYSDAAVIGSNTSIAYLATGLESNQVRNFLERCRRSAADEKAAREEVEPHLMLEETSIAIKFQKGLGYSLFDFDPSNAEDIAKVEKLLMNGSDESMELMLDFVIHTELSAV
jgi:hypothetical protein